MLEKVTLSPDSGGRMHPKSVLVIVTFGDQQEDGRFICIPIGTADVDDQKTVEPVKDIARRLNLGIDGLNRKFGAAGFNPGPIKAVILTAECPGHKVVVPTDLDIRACISAIESEYRTNAA